jgi:rhodanese-related sulfurtransferase
MQMRDPVGHISCEDAEAAIARGDTLVLDVRAEAVFAKGHIEGAVNLLLRNICDVVDKTQPCHPLLIYCQHGNESLEYSRFFRYFGFSDVSSLEGGYDAWRQRMS